MNRLSNRKAWDSALPVQPRAAAPPFSGKKIETLLTGIAGPGGKSICRHKVKIGLDENVLFYRIGLLLKRAEGLVNTE